MKKYYSKPLYYLKIMFKKKKWLLYRNIKYFKYNIGRHFQVIIKGEIFRNYKS